MEEDDKCVIRFTHEGAMDRFRDESEEINEYVPFNLEFEGSVTVYEIDDLEKVFIETGSRSDILLRDSEDYIEVVRFTIGKE